MRCREGFSDTLVFNAMFPLQGSYLSLKSVALPTELRAQSERFALTIYLPVAEREPFKAYGTSTRFILQLRLLS